VGWRPDLQKEVQNAGKLEARRHGGGEHQAACRKVLPAEDGTLPHGRIPALDKILPDPPVLVVPVPQEDETPPLEEVSEMEEGVEDLVGGGLQGDGKGASGKKFCIRMQALHPNAAYASEMSRRSGRNPARYSPSGQCM